MLTKLIQIFKRTTPPDPPRRREDEVFCGECKWFVHPGDPRVVSGGFGLDNSECRHPSNQEAREWKTYQDRTTYVHLFVHLFDHPRDRNARNDCPDWEGK